MRVSTEHTSKGPLKVRHLPDGATLHAAAILLAFSQTAQCERWAKVGLGAHLPKARAAVFCQCEALGTNLWARPLTCYTHLWSQHRIGQSLYG